MTTFRSFILCLCVLLAGCATTQQPTTSSTTSTTTTGTATTAANTTQPALTWEQRYSQLKQVGSWSLNGSVSIQRANKTDMASMQWQQQQPHVFNVALYGPLSLGRISIASSGNSVTLTQSGKQPVSATSAEQLMQQQLGWQLPVSNLYYWVRGIPAPGSTPKMTFDNSNHVLQLVQQGWLIDYQNYQPTQQVDLPHTIVMNNPNLHVRFVIKNWSI